MPAPKLDAPKMPVQICAGRLGKIGEIKENRDETKHYYSLPLEIEGLGGSPTAKVWFTWRPEFFSANVRDWVSGLPKKGDEEPGELTRGSAEFVYARNIIGDDMSLLQAVAGSEEKFNALYDALAATDAEPGSVREVFVETFGDGDEPPPMFYFTRQQAREKIGDGEYRAKSTYDVGRFFYADDKKSMKYYQGKAAKDEINYEFTFDPELI